MDLVRETKRFLQEQQLVSVGDTIICAVSGGADSMVLLRVLHHLAERWELRLAAAHVHHGFRGAESDREAELVRTYVEELGVPFEYHRADAPAYARERGMNAQAAARDIRYRFLEETAERYHADSIATAHHGDDQAETVLLNMLSGAGLKGLSGIAPNSTQNQVKRIRPFLRISKREIIAFAERHRVPYCHDSSNFSGKYDRNRLRLEVMPKLLAFNPNLPEALGRMADVIRAEDDFLETAAKEAAARIAMREDGRVTVRRDDFRKEPIALQRRLIKLILNYLANDPRFSDHEKIESVRTAIEGDTPSLSLHIGSSIRFKRVYDRLEWTKLSDEEALAADVPADFAYLLNQGDRRLVLPESRGELLVETGAPHIEAMLPAGHHEAWFDADLLEWPLTVRSRRAGDRIEALGVNGSKKVKDMFIDLKIDPSWRDRVPLVTDAAGRVLWIPGIRRSRHALVTERSTCEVRLRFARSEPHSV